MTTPAPIAGNDRQLEPAEFTRISQIAYREAGLAIPLAKLAMVQTRLARRLRLLNLPSYGAYCAFVESDKGQEERRELISALTTNVSHFFREGHHFDFLRDHVLASMAENQQLRLWSAGCSNGQEPYSLAMTLMEYQRGENSKPLTQDVKILASDIDPKVLKFAQSGRYSRAMINGIDSHRLERFFTREDGIGEYYAVNSELKQRISFRELNLVSRWPMRGPFDVIFCRNTVIYFDEDTQKTLWNRFAKIISPGGWLFVGHSERVSGESEELFEKMGNTIYRRRALSPSSRNERH